MDANDFPRLFYTSMPSSSTSTHRIDRLSSSSSSTFRRDDFRRHSTTTSSAKFSTISIGESVKLEEENGEIPEKFVQEEDTVVKTEETRVSDCDFSLTFYTAHVTSSSMLSRGDSSSINNKTFTPDDHYSNPSDKRREVPSIRSTSSNSSSFGGHVAFVDEPSEENQRQQQQYQQHQFQLPTLLVTSTPSTVFDQNDDDVFTSPYHPPNRQYSSSSEMSGLSFQLQSGIHKKSIAVEGNEIALRDLRNEAFQFVKEIYPEKKCGSLEDYILLYKHDLRSINILQLITTSSDVTDGTLVEIVIGSCPQNERIVVHPHTLFVHSYKVPTFCDFCGELLFGLVKQGLKCFGCGLNYHKRCASKIPNNCNGSKQRRPSAIPLSPSNSNILNLNERRQSRRDSCLEALDAARPSSTLGGAATPNIFITSDDCGDPVGGNFLQMPRKDRSCSWSGRPLWMEIAEATRVKVPHTFQVHSYKLPTVCQHCKKLLKGLLRQGMQCRDCKYNCHKKCSEHVAKDCSGNTKASQFFLGTADDGVSEDRDDDLSLRSGSGGHKKAQNTPSAPLQGSEGSGSPGGAVVSFAQGLSNAPDDDVISSESANIPLMRVVMSKKQTKRKNNKLLKEGWIVHYTDQQNMRKKHYWRLDTKGITMYQDENTTRYYKEIPLNEILGVMTSSPEKSSEYLFEIRTGACVYFVSGSPADEKSSGSLDAQSWTTAIQSALMPVTPQSSVVGGKRVDKLKVPTEGETGHLGAKIQTEQEFSQLYQIFAEEVLGSGQFGTVYGGIHRRNGQHVAVKLIDKLKFPPNKEDLLRAEVQILEQVDHPGVVHFMQMLETTDRIFVVMEKLKGDMLEMILSSEKGRLSERTTQFLVAQILEALRYLHHQNIVHCDLKPENILLNSNSDFPQVKLCDFGFARIIGEKSFRRSVVGTPAYLAPEVLRNKGFNRSLDMWSVGVIVYVSLSGTFPFNEDEDINDQIQNAEFMYPPSPWKEISENAIEFINGLLQVKMSKRYTVAKAQSHIWMQNYTIWSDLRVLEKAVGQRFVTHESDDSRWHAYEKEHNVTPVYV
ncbi:hypothetical protein L5515_009343 [Caenorhabditis briggsae]|uniref:Serine/threonine-protein kinase dkf-2 n=2 Tax=Caenorhabditis briggsae TaxID=6238 RepID=A0AAE9F3A2_CAEBR|nr:hypothetical protein L5515_009343 [Caenorhabditis briggsae]